MTQQTQTQRVKRDGKWRQVEDVVEELPAETTAKEEARDELLEEAECCLADIEEVLKDCEPKLTDEDILEKGHPDWYGDKYDIDYSLKGKEYDDAYDKAYAQFKEDEERFHETYERVHGVAYEHDGCGCSW